MKGKISRTGYKSDSPDKKNDFNVINSNVITMKNVPHPVLGIDDTGHMQMMMPGEEYKFGGSKVLEIPMKKMGGDTVYPFFLNMGGMPQFKAQDGKEVKTVGKAAKASAEEQKLARQYNFEGLPSITERNTWNDFLKNVQSQYPLNSEQAKTLNYGKPEDAQKKFNELSTAYNTDTARIKALKDQYAKVSASPQFDKTITQDQFVNSRMVNPQMMQNAQKFYGQQTAKDAWFGSETAQTFYPTISGMAQGYPGVTSQKLQQLNTVAVGKLAPVMVTPYGSKTASDYRGAAVITGYDASGNPIIDYSTTKPFTQDMASNVYFDKSNSDENLQKRFSPFLPQQQMGGVLDKEFFNNFLSDYFKKDKSEAPQGQDTSSFVENKKLYFLNHLKKNVAKDLVNDEVDGFSDYIKKAQDGLQVNLYDQNDPTKTPPPLLNYYTGPFGPYGNTQNPDYVAPQTSQYPAVTEQPNDVVPPSNLDLRPGVNMNNVAYQNFVKDYNKKYDNSQKADKIATGAVAGMNLFSSVVEGDRDRKLQKKYKDQMSAENLFSDQQPRQGDYDINSGAFRPNQMTAGFYKKGGQYLADDKEIARLKKLGYTIEIVNEKS